MAIRQTCPGCQKVPKQKCWETWEGAEQGRKGTGAKRRTVYKCPNRPR